MTKNNKPILSILIDEDKRAKFSALAKRNSLSMSYLVNQAIDRMLEADSIEESIESSVGTSVGSSIDSSVCGTIQTIEELVKSYIEAVDIEQLVKSYVDTSIGTSVGASIETTDIEELIKSYVDNHNSSVVSIDDANRLIAVLEYEVAMLADSNKKTLLELEYQKDHSDATKNSLAELETRTESQFASMKEEIKALADRAVVVPATDYPDWVKAAHKPHYNRLSSNPDLLSQVATVCALTDSNDSIAIALIPLGFKKGDGTPLDRPTITNIKKVVENLKMNG